MPPIEQHWLHIRSLLKPGEYSDEQLKFLREIFFGGALSTLAILADLNQSEMTDEEFDKRLCGLFLEASSGVMARYRKEPCVHTHLSASSRRH
jgi:hypothetical protein